MQVRLRARENNGSSSPSSSDAEQPLAASDPPASPVVELRKGQGQARPDSSTVPVSDYVLERSRGGGNGASRGTWKWVGVALGVAVGLLLLGSWATALDSSHHNFVKVEGIQFTLGCRPFYVAGFNVDNVAQAPVAHIAKKLSGGVSGRQKVRDLFQQAAAAGLNVVRTFAHTTDPNFPLQVKPGQYDEEVFRGLDYTLAEAQRAGLRVVLSFADNWKYSGGVDEYVDWSDTAPARDAKYPPNSRLGDTSVEDYTPERLEYENKRKALFYTNLSSNRMYKDHMRAVLERRNFYTGRVYRDDPTIMAFDLVNEPRCSTYETASCLDTFHKWVLDQATYFKSLDQNHLLTIGSEGFWGERDSMRENNPGAPGSDWAARAGQDFVANNDLPMIDFAVIHMWPDNWKTHNKTFQKLWIEKHIEDSSTLLKMPVMLEEVGKILGRGRDPPPEAIAEHRDPVFEHTYAAVERALGLKEALVGSLFWRWGFNVYENDQPGPYGVLPSHSTFKIITQHAQRVKAFMNSQPPDLECHLDCWVPTTRMFGVLRRCEHRPAVCEESRGRLRQLPSANDSSPLAAQGSEVFTSLAECCRPGLGGFQDGCSLTL